MINSMYRKLIILFIISFLLTVLIITSMARIYREQQHTGDELRYLARVQLSIDMLRSQLWFFSQRGDEQTFRQVDIAQQELSDYLQEKDSYNLPFAGLIKMNNSLAHLLRQEMLLKKRLSARSRESEQSINPVSLLHARYNMLIQNMTEEIAYVHKILLDSNEQETRVMMYYSSAILILSSIMLSLIALSILRRFRKDRIAFQTAIFDLSQGMLGTKINYQKLDNEFVELAKVFNRMSSSLRLSLVTKKELEEEVCRQTAELEKQKQRLEFLSEHDPLTNLMNRRALEKAIDEAMIRAGRTGKKLALLFIDLDHFKAINDQKGHDAGDLILTTVANRLKESIRETDLLGRLGGDEFLLCLDLMDDFTIVCQKAREIIELIGKPVAFGGENLFVGASIGVSYFPDHTEDRSLLIQKADMAMYHAKSLPGSVCSDGTTLLAEQ
ncbi:GGDEF domain-containing protein [Vibrio sp. HA2012]|uniref:diguanylate cyclase n=1 Tax=Vibrio sp. HA2012 TaxID=1971595 RepID=UPI000C2C0909|nr:diguanylate cyclase [Vibrio sp. HA2012]PJC85928.1 GGDEF domain-containing protein [Vibrio sp. HA2012]